MAWLRQQPLHSLATTAVTVAEIRCVLADFRKAHGGAILKNASDPF